MHYSGFFFLVLSIFLAQHHGLPLQDLKSKLCTHSLLVLHKDSWLRHKVLLLVHWKVFEGLTLAAILVNCIFLAMDRWGLCGCGVGCSDPAVCRGSSIL
jgi:hypothetical protein